MNEKLLYEQIISEKLHTLPVPDMADAIWARIEKQLDIDMPTDDGGGSNPPSPDAPAGGSNLLGHIGVSIGLIALITFFYINKKQKAETLQPSISLPATGITPTDNAPPEAPPPNTTPYTTVPLNSNRPVAPQKEAQDSIFSKAVVAAPSRADSIAIGNELIAGTQPPLAAPAAVDTVPKKRQRGVPLNNGDYRIVPKNDSLP